MKKILSLLMIAIMVLGTGLNVYASQETFTSEDLEGETSKVLEVKVDFVPYEEPEVICLGIEWAGFNPKYTEAAKSWNPTTLEYDYSDEEGTWTNPDIQGVNHLCPIVQITNKSNVDLDVSVNFEKNSDYVTKFVWVPSLFDGCVWDESNSNSTYIKFDMQNKANPSNLEDYYDLTKAPAFKVVGEQIQLTDKVITEDFTLGHVSITIE